MSNAHPPAPSSRQPTVSRGFSYAFIGIVTLILIAFAAVGVVFNIILIEGELDKRLDGVIELARTRLPAPMKNLNDGIINSFVETIFLDASIVYTKISREDQVVIEKQRPGFELQALETPVQSSLFLGSKFIVKSSDIEFAAEIWPNQ